MSGVRIDQRKRRIARWRDSSRREVFIGRLGRALARPSAWFRIAMLGLVSTRPNLQLIARPHDTSHSRRQVALGHERLVACEFVLELGAADATHDGAPFV